MSIIVAIIIGGVIGWIAARLAGRHEGVLASIVIGIIGSIIGGALASLFGSSNQSYTSFTWSGVLWSLIGSIILVGILNAVQGRPTRHIQE